MFRKAFTHLKNKIQFLADNHKLNDKQLADYNEILTGLLAGYEEERRMNKYLLNQLHKISSDYNQLDKQYQEHVKILEAICLVHGIIDINMYLSRGSKMIEQEIVITQELGGFIMPLAFREKEYAKQFLNTWKQKYESTN